MVSACGSQSPTSPATSTKQLEVVSWWTSSSESAALNDLFAAFRQANPGVTAINAAVAGGAGSSAIVELAKRLQRNDPPDVWQTFAGKSVQGYASRGVTRSVASIFAREHLNATMNPTILTALMHDHQPYGVPTGAHRSNVLWFNTKLLERAGVARPSSGYTVDSFINDLRKIKASGLTPLCLGAKDRFTTVELFENTLLSSIGSHGWEHMVHNGLDWRSKQVQTALNNFGAILRYADPEANQLTWDQATKKLAAGGCAFESMNDSAFGELIADGAHEGTGFDGVPFPGTQGSFLAVVDVFVAATKAKNAKNALAFLSGIDNPATQLAFSKAIRAQSPSSTTSTSRRCPPISGHPRRRSGRCPCCSPSPTAKGSAPTSRKPSTTPSRPTYGHATPARSQTICTNGSHRARSRNADPPPEPSPSTRK